MKNQQICGGAGDTDDAEKYGNIITYGGTIADTAFDLSSAELRPCDVSGATLVTASYGNDGRVDALDTSFTETADAGTEILAFNGENYAVRTDFWIKSNIDGTLQLTAAADRGMGTDGGESTVSGYGSFERYRFDVQLTVH